jgi:hypothetical protein
MKKALLIGINYKDTKYPLQGCWNDVEQMKTYLQKNGYMLTIMTDEPKNKNKPLYPTYTNFLKQLETFLTKASPLDTLFFYYSGHGERLRDQRIQKDEKDNMDENLCLLSDKTTNQVQHVSDDQIRAIINRMSNFTKLRCVFDCCHSGTVMDLPFRMMNKKTIHTESSPSIKNVLMISGCEDNDTSLETIIDNKVRGALTSLVIPLFESENKKIKWTELLEKIQESMVSKGYKQVPQISFTSNSVIQSKLDL